MKWCIELVFLVATCRTELDIALEDIELDISFEEGLGEKYIRLLNEPVVFFNTVNRCSQDLWIGAIGISNSRPSFTYEGLNYYVPNQGGWHLPAGESTNISVPYDWKAGRFWARTGCTGTIGKDFHCETGDCGPQIKCSTGNIPRSGKPPATLAELTLNVYDIDYYDISLVDGFNVPMKIEPYKKDCINPESLVDLNKLCPCVLSVNGINGSVIACDSACTKFDTDQYCCRPPCCGNSSTCNPDKWPVDYAKFFKAFCPQANSYAFDSQANGYVHNNVFDNSIPIVIGSYINIDFVPLSLAKTIAGDEIVDLTSHTFTCSNTNYNIYFC